MRRTLIKTQMLYVSVGEAIRKARYDAVIQASVLAKKIGITPSHLQKIESGETACALHVLVSIADELDLSLDELCPVNIDEKEIAS